MPFHGSDASLETVLERLAGLRTREGDTITVADNRPTATHAWQRGAIAVLPAPAEQSAYHARNVAVRAGSNPWILFIDSDVRPPAGLLDAYFREVPGERAGVVAGAIRDAAPAPDEGIAARYAFITQTLAHENVLQGEHAYAQTANALVRREALERVGGFEEGIRSGGDADLCFRIVAAGWSLEARAAEVEHLGRPSVRKLLRQYLRYGAGSAWLDERHPGFLQVRPWTNLVIGVVRGTASAAVHLARGQRDDAIVKFLRPLTRAAFRIGSRLPNAAVPTRVLLRRVLLGR
jgi:GT2 family glycosyltransferase